MKRIILILLIFVCSSKIYSQWQQQVSNTVNTLNSVFFINNNTGWACGLETVLKTTNCGITWNAAFLAGYHKSIVFSDENNGWICGENGKIFKTTNGGINWNPVNSGVISRLNQIAFINQNTGIIAGSNNIILKTTDSGISWNNVNSFNTSLDFNSVKILNNNKYFVTGTESTIFTSSNAGLTWDSLSFGMPNPLLTVEFINNNTGWVSGCCGMFMKTTNGGKIWSPEVYLTPGYSVNSMKFINENTGWAVCDAGYILRTTNSGQNWDSLNSLTHSGLYSAYFINKDTGFVSGYNGFIIRTTNGGGIGFPLNINQVSGEIPEFFSLSQNYPNPFNPETKINYELPASRGEGIPNYVSLIVYDVLGNEIKTLVNEKQYTGSYSVKFDGTGLSSGIYFYKLKTNSFLETKKMLLIK